MDRVPEPELMDSLAQAAAYAAADFEEPHGRFIELFRKIFPDYTPSGPVLDLGCGPADISIRFARAFPVAKIDGLDAGPNMLAHGRAAVERAGLADRITLAHGRIPDAAPPREKYDVLISNSLLHHLPEPLDLWRVIQRHAAEDARIFVMDLCRPSSTDEAERLVEEHAAGEPEVLRRDFFNSLLAAYTPEEVGGQLATVGLRNLEINRPTELHLIARGCR